MQDPYRRSRLGLIAGTAAILVALGLGGTRFQAWGRSRDRGREGGHFSTSVVQRVDLDVTLRAPGRVESSESTLIECELEQLNARASGGSLIRTSGVSTIIEIAPEGVMVEAGQSICRFDSSEYEEMVRQQQIVVEAAGSDRKQALLDLEASQIAFKEYQEGTRLQQLSDFQRRITLAEGQAERQRDCLAWAERLIPLGYISPSRLQQEQQLQERAQIELQRSRDALETYRTYTEEKLRQSLQSVIHRRTSTLRYLDNRLRHEEAQLAHHREQVEKCSIRAPHAGMLIYANDDDDGDDPIQVGGRAHYKMDLFLLPNLQKIVVETVLNETVVRHVRPGMTTQVRAEALPGRSFTGVVKAVDQLPADLGSWRRRDIRQYNAIVELDAPRELLPGMTAEVEILTDTESDTLVVPAQAVAIEEGRNFCYVAGADGIERRDVTFERGTIDLLQITGGLDEGEAVVLQPSSIDPDVIEVIETSPDVEVSSGVKGLAALHGANHSRSIGLSQ